MDQQPLIDHQPRIEQSISSLTAAGERERRWESEARYFDRLADTSDIGPIRPKTLARYRHPWRTWLEPEYRFRLAGNLAGKRVLDVGCGDGRSSVILAKLGAHVTGIDVSRGAIGAAQERAAVNGVASNATFICAPLEACDVADGSFDLVWCEAFLHHVIDDLPAVLGSIRRSLVPGGRAIIVEPINLSPRFRQLRLALFRPPDATDNERPLEAPELALIHRAFDRTAIRYFGLLGRLDRLVLSDGYEYSPLARRALSNVLRLADRVVFRVPSMHALASVAVIVGWAAQ